MLTAKPLPGHVSGEVNSIVYRDSSDDWSVVRVTLTANRQQRVVLGCTDCHEGQVIEADGEWRDNPPHGLQFFATNIVASSPITPNGLVSYLASGVFPGIGPKVALAIFKKFGMDTFAVLDDEPERLTEINGIGPSRAARIRVAWKREAIVSSIMAFLHSQNIKSSMCRRIYKALGDEATTIIRQNPYCLCTAVRGVGFKTADEIAANLGVPRASEQRVLAAFSYQIGELTRMGHCGCERAKFVQKCTKLLEIPSQRVAEVLDAALAVPQNQAGLVCYDNIVYPIRLAHAEEAIASMLRFIVKRTPHYANRVSDELIAAAAKSRHMRLARKQEQAVRAGLTRSVSVVTGGPGCGKTATLNVLLSAYATLGLSVELAAPTGKAAQRASEATGYEAKTLHRLLGLAKSDDEAPPLSDAADSASAKRPWNPDVVVVDEMSMVDVPLAYRLLRALGSSTSLVMVGDVDQLPSVGPGQVLADIIDSGAIPVTVLDEVFRQAAGSAIITNAHAINTGRMPASAGAGGDFFVLTEKNVKSIAEALAHPDPDAIAGAAAEAVAREIEMLVAERLPRAYHVSPREVQVLTPMMKGACGVLSMNERLQARLNPDPSQSIQHNKVRYGVGDKVIQRRNNYALGIFNGDAGYITAVGLDDCVLRVAFAGGEVDLEEDDLDDLSLDYARTVHKSQGSQSKIVVVPMVSQHWNMLQRNLLYTAVTRASKIGVVIGQERAIAQAVWNVQSSRRITRLRDLLYVPEAGIEAACA